jgi:hypothetical protein
MIRMNLARRKMQVVQFPTDWECAETLSAKLGEYSITFDRRISTLPLARVSRLASGSVEKELSIASSLQFEEF